MWLETPSLGSPQSPHPSSLDPFSALSTIISDHDDPLQFPFPLASDFLNLQHPFLDNGGDFSGDIRDNQFGSGVCDNGGDEKDDSGPYGGCGGGFGNSWSFGMSITKAARSKRRIARKNSQSFSTRFVKSRPTTASSKECRSKKREQIKSVTNRNMVIQDPSLNKSLRLILQKELKNSDVSSLGRVILPKKEAEANLPSLADKEGIKIKFKDIGSSQAWNLRYREVVNIVSSETFHCVQVTEINRSAKDAFRFWPNNKSRMYVLENTGDFVKKYHLHCGDFILLFRDDETRQFFISARKLEESICSTYNWNDEEMHEAQNDRMAPSDASRNHGGNVGELTVGNYPGEVGMKLVRQPSHAGELGEDGEELPTEDFFGSCSSLVSCIVDDLHEWNISSLERFDSFEDSDLFLYNKMLDMDEYDVKKLA